MELVLRVLDNYAGFLIRSGYVEKAIGLYQALVDFNLCVTSRTETKYANLDAKSRFTLFELFWDMGLPKFGEAHSLGWLQCLADRDVVLEKSCESALKGIGFCSLSKLRVLFEAIRHLC